MKSHYMKSICLVFILGILCFPDRSFAQKVISRSENKRPDWLAKKLPKTTNNTFYYQIAEAESLTFEGARIACLTNLTTYIKQNYDIATDSKAEVKLSNTEKTTEEKERYDFKVDIKGESIKITSSKQDEYWEQVDSPGGKSVFRCYTLYAVARNAGGADFDQLSFSRRYGARGLVRSAFIPGWGQMYKGSMVKGGLILGGEVVFAAGIVISENLRSNYAKKASETRDIAHRRSYINQSDNCTNIRNICIGGAAAIYVYNLVDAIVANGTKRSIVRKSRGLVFRPVAGKECNGVSLAYQF